MYVLKTRVPIISWEVGFERCWIKDNPVMTHWFNALSFLFPKGEQFFIDSAKIVMKDLDFSDDLELYQALKIFITQEMIHSRQHEEYNAVLLKQGYENVSAELVDKLIDYSSRYLSPLTRLAIVCGYEHYTAVLGDYLFRNVNILENAPPAMQLIWAWHAMEEIEHKAVCYDLYKKAGGGWGRRVLSFVQVNINFTLLVWKLYLALLRQDGLFQKGKRAKTLRQMLSLFFGGNGMVWHTVKYGLSYLKPNFHPNQYNNEHLIQAWQEKHEYELRLLQKSQ